MSLKSKLEAVIYAAEEPVTLTQLAALFATEALEWKAEQEAASAAQAARTAADDCATNRRGARIPGVTNRRRDIAWISPASLCCRRRSLSAATANLQNRNP